jgi:hypothetical protein
MLRRIPSGKGGHFVLAIQFAAVFPDLGWRDGSGRFSRQNIF